jgi:lysophospholipase L1-like esterase
VTFKLDGTAIGTEDTTEPYAITWDSTTATAGAHTLVAVARDTAGNYATSTSVSVTVVLYPPYASDLAVFFDAGQSAMTTSSGLVSSITDLSSLNVVATSSGSLRPTLVTYGAHNGVRFSNAQELMAGTGWTMNRQNSSLFIVSRTQLGGTGGLNTYALTYMPQSGGTNRLASYFNGNTFSGYDSAAKSSGFIHGHGIETDYMVLSTTTAKLGVGPQETSLAAFPAGTVSGAKIGRWDGTSFPLDQTDILAIVAYNRSLYTAESAAVRDWLSSQYGALPRTANTAIVFEGDSLTYGVDASDNITMSYPAQLSRLSSTPPKIWNGGSGGDTALNNAAAASTKTILTGVSGYTNRLVVYWLGTNDIANGRTAVQLEGDISSYITAVRAHDAGAVIFGNTIIARDPFNASQDTEIADVNAWIRSSAGFDHVIDLAADTRLSDATNATYFYSDGIHLTDTGYGVVANLVRTAVNAAGYGI